MADDPKPAADTRTIVCVAVKANGCPEMGTAKSVEAVPDRAMLVCRVGDREWTRRETIGDRGIKE